MIGYDNTDCTHLSWECMDTIVLVSEKGGTCALKFSITLRDLGFTV